METRNIIYKITNLINGKIYIGKTCDYSNRMSGHKSGKSQIIGKAIQKYGKDNFTFEKIHFTETYEELEYWENYYIDLYNSLLPNGYNVIKTDGKNVIIHKETIKKFLLKNLDRKYNYRGVFKNNHIYYCKMTHKGIHYSKSCPTLEEAAQLYDMLLIHFYGADCVVNFPDKLEEYLESDKLKNILEICQDKRDYFTSHFYSVTWKPKAKNWSCYYYDNNKKQISIGSFKNERAAAFIRDIFLTVRSIKNQKLNFPNIITAIPKEKIAYWYNKIERMKCPSRKGVFYKTSEKRWRANYCEKGKKIHLGRFKTQQEASDAVTNYMKINNKLFFTPVTVNDF